MFRSILEQYRLIYGLNPVAGVIEGCRSALLDTNPMPWDLLMMGTITTVITAFVGIIVFSKLERSIVDVA
jgi:lipopolysaccharide transport system permease protein